MARLTWVRAVAGLMYSSAAISSLLRPAATSATTSRSRSVSDVEARRRRRCGPAGWADELGDQPPGDAGRQQRLAVGHDPDGPQQLLRLGVLDAGSRWRPARSASKTYSSSSKVVRTTTRTSARSGSAAIAAGGGEAVEPGIRMSISTTSGRSRPTRATASSPSVGLAHHLDVGLGVEQEPDAGPHQCLVVGDHDADHGLTPPAPAG